mgnify:CR=1 FL=1
MFKYIIFSVISFMLGIFAREIIDIIERKQKYEKVKKLSEQDFKQAMKDLEIK